MVWLNKNLTRSLSTEAKLQKWYENVRYEIERKSEEYSYSFWKKSN